MKKQTKIKLLETALAVLFAIGFYTFIACLGIWQGVVSLGIMFAGGAVGKVILDELERLDPNNEIFSKKI